MSEKTLPGPDKDRSRQAVTRLDRYMARAKEQSTDLIVEGVLRRTVGLAMEAEGCHAALGGRCDVVADDGRRVETEVAGNRRDQRVQA